MPSKKAVFGEENNGLFWEYLMEFLLVFTNKYKLCLGWDWPMCIWELLPFVKVTRTDKFLSQLKIHYRDFPDFYMEEKEGQGWTTVVRRWEGPYKSWISSSIFNSTFTNVVHLDVSEMQLTKFLPNMTKEKFWMENMAGMDFKMSKHHQLKKYYRLVE